MTRRPTVDRLLTMTQIAERLGIAKSVVSRRIAARGVRHVLMVGSAKLYDETAIKLLAPMPHGRPRRETND
jgi:hypothetical protein